MRRYYMELIVRVNEDAADDTPRGEWMVKYNVTAENRVSAKRSALNRAYAHNLLVSRFNSIKERAI